MGPLRVTVSSREAEVPLLSASPTASLVPAKQLAGRWFFCDDGWLGTLTLAASGEQSFTGTFAAERFGDDFAVSGQLNSPDPHSLDMVFHDYNWMPEQRYVGHVMTQGRSMIAGYSLWQGMPFGFFATRSAKQLLGTYRPGAVRGSDFAGSWNAYLDGEPATVVLGYNAADGQLRGTYSSRTLAADYLVVGRPGGAAPHSVSLRLLPPDSNEVAAELSGNLMSRPKNAISGSAVAAGSTYGVVMIRYE
jgi:hypothetical protein